MDTPKAMSNSDPNQRLRALVDRIERLSEEKVAISSDIRDIFVEAKDSGYDTRVLRAVLRRRAQDPKELEEFETELERYEAALGVPA